MLKSTTIWPAAAALILVACSIEDSDRCLDGYHWVSEQQACVEDEETDEDEPPQLPDTEENGNGVVCQSADDCTELEAKFCLKSPLDPSGPGICTVENCVPEDCGDFYTCCDCGESAMVNWANPYCIMHENVPPLTAAGCVCE